jgi:hypothetical protein
VFLQIGFHDFDDVPEQRGMILVEFVGDATLERDGGKLSGAGQSDLDGKRAVSFEERKFVAGERLELAEFCGDDASDAADESDGGLSGLPDTADGVGEIEACDGIGEIAHEIAAAEFAIGGGCKAEFFLFGEDAEDVLVFDLAEMFWRGGAAGFEQFRWTEKAANVIGAEWCGHGVRLLLKGGESESD